MSESYCKDCGSLLRIVGLQQNGGEEYDCLLCTARRERDAALNKLVKKNAQYLMEYGYREDAEQERDKAQAIIEQIPQLIEIVCEHCKVPYIERPSLYKRGDLWRYHKVRAGNQWADAKTPLEAALQLTKESDDE